MPNPYTPAHALWKRWVRMMERCYAPGDPCFRDYGMRGILVADEWHSFSRFATDMGLPSSPDESLDRIDNSKGYSPDNVRWASKTEQARNRRNTHTIIVAGVERSLCDVGDETGVDRNVWYTRIRRGWTPEQAVGIAPAPRSVGRPPRVGVPAPLQTGVRKPPTRAATRSGAGSTSFIDLKGQTFGRLTVDHYVGSDPVRGPTWLCLCSCGVSIDAFTRNLRDGTTKSCGCLLAEYRANMKENAPHKSHGMSKTPTFVSWVVMRRNHAESVCDEWASFETFLEDMGEKPEKMRLLRADKKQKFSKDNCLWG